MINRRLGSPIDEAEEEFLQLKEFVKNDAEIVVVIGAEASPSCGVNIVGRWREGSDPASRRFPDDVDFIHGRGVYMEELEKLFESENIKPYWIGMPGISLKNVFPELFKETIRKVKEL